MDLVGLIDSLALRMAQELGEIRTAVAPAVELPPGSGLFTIAGQAVESPPGSGLFLIDS